jgi:hypothetical protein
MSASPRVAPRTRPPKPRAVKLPKLRYGVYVHGELKRIEEVEDPRVLIAHSMAEDFGDLGFSIRPIVAESEVAHA